MPAHAEHINSLRVVVRPHLNRNTLEILAKDIVGACAWLKEHAGNATPPKLHDPYKSSQTKC